MIRLNQLIDKISTKNNIPKGRLRQIINLISEEIIQAIENDEKIVTPRLFAATKTIPAKDAEGDIPSRPERKVLNVRIRQDNISKNDG